MPYTALYNWTSGPVLRSDSALHIDAAKKRLTLTRKSAVSRCAPLVLYSYGVAHQ